jgi:hypothetical protein
LPTNRLLPHHQLKVLGQPLNKLRGRHLLATLMDGLLSLKCRFETQILLVLVQIQKQPVFVLLRELMLSIRAGLFPRSIQQDQQHVLGITEITSFLLLERSFHRVLTFSSQPVQNQLPLSCSVLELALS